MKQDPERQVVIPFLKWAGGKQWLTPKLKPLVERTKGRYIEPFLGGGSVFFATLPGKALLSDCNPELIDTYQTVRKEAARVIARLRRFSFTKDCYYRVRQSKPKSPVGRAARFIFLNRTCWNGLYRVNREGAFNVPMGSFDATPDFQVAERLIAAQRALQSATILCQDFEDAIQRAKPGDTVYLDPPYTVAHKNNGFLRYNELVFSWYDQQRLALAARALRERGCMVILSNVDHPGIADLYKGFRIKKLERRSLVAGETTKRRLITELLITSFLTDE